MLRKRVIDVAVKEINEKTDIQASYELQRSGRKVMAILFKIKGTAPSSKTIHKDEDIISKLAKYGIRQKQAEELLRKHDKDYILANIDVVEEDLKNGKIKYSISGYMMRAFEADFRPLKTEHDLKEEEKKQQQEAEKKVLELKEKQEQQARETLM